MIKRIAIIVGHASKSQGAVNYLDETEYRFNSRIAKKLFLRLKGNGVESYIFIRPDGAFSTAVYKVCDAVNEYGPSISVELHFNSWEKEAFGAEILGKKNGNHELANNFLTAFESIGIRNRGLKILEPKSRGYRNLTGIDTPYAYIIEPCFGDFRTVESIEIFEQEDRYVKLLADVLINFEKKEEV